MKKRSFSVFLILVIILSLFCGTVCYAAGNVPRSVMSAADSVVRIVAEYSDGYASGSGFVVSNKDGQTYIATNNHVIEGNPYSVSVFVDEYTTATAEIIATAPQKDMAILRLPQKTKLKPLTISKSSASRGDAVYAIGFPADADYLSDYISRTSEDSTITDGIVGAVREATLETNGTPVSLLQINVAINHGNSGGPLLNKSGEVVGINTYSINDTQGINGAISSTELSAFLASKNITFNTSTSNLFIYIALTCVAVLVLLLVVAICISRKKAASVKKSSKTVTLSLYLEKLNRPLTPEEAVSIIMPVIVQLRDMHNDGKLHLQVAPNTIVLENGAASLCSPTGDEAHRYANGFAAPEVYSGVPKSKSDVYSVTAVLLYLISGVVPANSLSRQNVSYESSIIADVQSNLPTELASTLESGMAVLEDKRLTIQDLINALSPYNTGAFADVVNEVRTEPFAKSTVKRPRKKISKKVKKIIFSIAAIIIVIPILYCGSYYGALKSANNGNFVLASKLMIIPSLTELHDSCLPQFIKAGEAFENEDFGTSEQLFSELGEYLNSSEMTIKSSYMRAAQLCAANKYLEAYEVYTTLGNYEDSAKNVNELKATLYQLGQERYRSALGLKNVNTSEYSMALSEAKNYFDVIPTYRDSQKYLDLLWVKSVMLTREIMNRVGYDKDYSDMIDILVKNFYFEDASKLLATGGLITDQYLLGKWSSITNEYWELKKGKNEFSTVSTYSLPGTNADKYEIVDGVYYEITDSGKNALWEFTICTPDTLLLYAYSNGQTYTLFRR